MYHYYIGLKKEDQEMAIKNNKKLKEDEEWTA